MATTAKTLKTCNCCLPRNWKPKMMGPRAEVAYCKSCKMTTIWSAADPVFLQEWKVKQDRRAALMAELMASVE